ncbi:MAG: alginate lyase family protein, partial [Chloroflexota bacterium]|nr:alginate lyase family protein [Chloroflexota bacterium]
IKFIWEPARFGWAYTLGRAYHLDGDEGYPQAFWQYTETFLDANPPNTGPNWASGQEVSLRILAFSFAVQIFAGSPHSTPKRIARLTTSIAAHAARIPPTLIYARSQNNNHLLSEAVGLLTAGLTLPNHPCSHRWLKLGQKWFNRALENQIDTDGAYVQQSTNYHRLMLQLALWVFANQRFNDSASGFISAEAKQNLERATRWLLALVDTETGRVPNLGANDGAYILPLTTSPFHDYRPVLQAASLAFIGQPAFESGPWDEMSLWLCQGSSILTGQSNKFEADSPMGAHRVQNPPTRIESSTDAGRLREPASISIDCEPLDERLRKASSLYHKPHIIRGTSSWAYLRAAKFEGRPGHADQLHLDLWWRGLNIAQDAGTYLYNAPPPWDNSLTSADVHNTITVNGRDQMTRAGRFLYLDRAQAKIVTHEKAKDASWERVVAQHDGYRQLGLIHQRSVTAHADGRWEIKDKLLPIKRATHQASATKRLHWLLPDWKWEFVEREPGSVKIRLRSPHGWIMLAVSQQQAALQPQLVRAGEVLHGQTPAQPTLGWVSPTYGQKRPALSFSVTTSATLSSALRTTWRLPTAEAD